ncbi:putative aldo/keto reductase [Colletotrichum plurivorum]|uniref:Putative aldo/keto reductase n=1 Tax=Colletotrichum plurivorum TaxID=2175906 RepID=A0A8H6KGV3_9PEZI|nr:putative aldo/keto reductase [Colletotrichum plurivorum]
MEPSVAAPRTSTTTPSIGFGVYQLRGEECTQACMTALGAGYRHIDTAQLYGNEAEVGRALRQTKLRREDIFLTTKIGRCEGGVEKAYRSALRSVGRIAGEDGHVDLFLIHRPVERRREIWLALERLMTEGRTGAIGVSNFREEHLEEMRGYASIWPPAVNQIEVHPWCQQRRLVAYCQKNGIVVQAYSPLARGQRMSDPVLARVVERVRRRLLLSETGAESGAGAGGAEAAEGREPARSMTTAQVLVRWSLQKGFVPLPKSSYPARIEANSDVFWFELDGEEMELLDGLDMGSAGALFPANVS